MLYEPLFRAPDREISNITDMLEEALFAIKKMQEKMNDLETRVIIIENNYLQDNKEEYP